jgi:formylglycine-generating enzyme required for sulfatase activity
MGWAKSPNRVRLLWGYSLERIFPANFVMWLFIVRLGLSGSADIFSIFPISAKKTVNFRAACPDYRKARKPKENNMSLKYRPIIILLLVGVFISACGPSLQQATTVPSTVAALPTVLPTVAPTALPTAIPTDIPTATISTTLVPGTTQVSATDGMVMVYVPAGEFSMGSQVGTVDEQPVHTVYLDAFWIDRTEVTNAMYSSCVDAGACLRPMVINSNTHYGYYLFAPYTDYPVIALKWSSADAYCTWAGRRLPTEAEWEKAAVGTDGRTYPWGNNEPNKKLLNFNRFVNDTTSVGSFPLGASPYGVWDMAGNLTEWVADWYDKGYYGSSPSSNPAGPASGDYKVLRGGSWVSNEYLVRSADRHWLAPDTREITVGFRCATTSP